ncbi:MAG: PilC/PilY family type IV pilus protein, partial [Thermodesulfobacteriota bacterium]|nr:PilC/PilY family type IV pilus protein [Thermodesulfobacteriota bacterium]
MQFNYGTGPGEGVVWDDVAGSRDIDGDGTDDLTWHYADGGRVRNYIGDTATTTDPHGDTVLQIIQNINQQEIQMNTPLEEVLWEATRYFQQVAPTFQPESTPDTPPNNAVDFEVNNTWDPYYFNNLGDFVPCAKSYIIYVTDGEGNENSGLPTGDWPAGANANGLTSDGSGYLDDIAFIMHTEDLRDDTAMGEASDLIDQTITLYTVFCFDDSNIARCELMKAARAGGFDDLNGDGDTGGTTSDDDPTAFVGDPEWDSDGNNIPDTYLEAQDGAQMEDQIMRAIVDVLSRTASGTAASVISNARGGEGAIYQAVFFTESDPAPLTAETVKWYGNVHSLFIDSYGNLREDTNTNDTLDIDTDYIIEFDGQTAKANRYDYDPILDTKTYIDDVDITDLNFIWDALSWLDSPAMNVTTQRTYTSNAQQRYIFTDLIDTSSAVSLNNVDNTQIMDFTPDFVNDAANDNYFFLNPYEVGLSEAQMISEAQNIINYVRGQEGITHTVTSVPYRSRTLDTDGDGSDDTVFRLGDIVHSTPTVVSQPAEYYDLMYKDNSYRIFRKQYIKRRTVVYAGANDGMLHAFNGGFYDPDSNTFNTRPKIWDGGTLSWIPDPSITNYDLGSELWAYVPNALLPHLKWLKEPLSDNTHVYYVDLKPRVFDARIFADDADHPGGWGTVLVGGMRLGGAPIGVDTDGDDTCDLNFSSTYFALDITNPEAPPSLLWSFNDSNLGFTTSYPTAMRVGTKWFVIFGSGPLNFDATRKDDGVTFTDYGGSRRSASIYVIDASDGTLAREFTVNNSYMADPIAVDFDLATTIDGATGHILWTGEAIYIANDGCGAGSEGKVFRIRTKGSESLNQWAKATFFNPNTAADDHQHINTALSVAQDTIGRIWVFFGTGRFWGSLDRQAPYFSYQNAFYGIKEPVDSDGDLTYGSVGAKENNLRNVTGIEIEDYNTISGGTPAVADADSSGAVKFNDLILEVKQKDGWYFNFSGSGERNLGQAAILGDIVLFTTFIPDNDLCAAEGQSYLYGVYYQTGTAYWQGVIKTQENNWTGIDTVTNKVVYKVNIGKGYSTTPNVHTGKEKGSKAFVQTSTGAIIGVQQANPGKTKSSRISWRLVQ